MEDEEPGVEQRLALSVAIDSCRLVARSDRPCRAHRPRAGMDSWADVGWLGHRSHFGSVNVGHHR